MKSVRALIGKTGLAAAVRENALAVYALLAEAEAAVHGTAPDQIHFHEVGALDALADILGCCLLMDQIAPDRVTCSPVCVGGGQVRCAHGILPVPAPAAARILTGVPVYGGGIRGELCTPTGAALLKHFVSSFDGLPAMKVSKIGYGMGKKDFAAANCVRALLGDSAEAPEEALELRCNIDDMSAERLSFAMEQLLLAGALEVYTLPAGMKKSRPGVLLCVLCKEDKKDELVRLIFRHTTTIGIRESRTRRYTLERHVESVDTVYGKVRLKRSIGYGVSREKYEYDDLAKIASEHDLAIDEVVKTIEKDRG